jgi:nicotinamide-nucleotide amidase
MLPGPPRELRPLLEYRVRPILARLSDAVIASHNIHFFGIGESEMEYRLRDYMQELSNPTLAPYAKTGECLVRVTAKAGTQAEAEAMMAPVIERVKGIFGDLVYAVDGLNLAEHTVKLLIEKGVTVAAAESCTGGELEKRITDIPGASAALRGGVVVYTNEAKHLLLGIPMETIEKHGAVSFEVAAELAERVRRKLGADLGVGVTGLAGPDGDGVHEVGTVFISLSDGRRTWVREKRLTSRDRATVRLYACQNAFDMLRRYLTGLPVEQERADI